MDAFNFAFSLFAILLGLSLAEVLAGFARAMRVRETVRLGWFTPLLAVVVMLDITSFWTGTWELRDYIKAQYGYLVVGLIVTGIYYLAASIVFPPHGENPSDFDSHYFAHRRQVFAAVAFCNLVTFTVADFVFPWAWAMPSLVSLILFYVLLAAGFISSNRVVNSIVLWGLIIFYLISGLWSVLAPRSA